MGEMRDSDWSRENLLRSDWLVPKGAIMTTVNPGAVDFKMFRYMTLLFLCVLKTEFVSCLADKVVDEYD